MQITYPRAWGGLVQSEETFITSAKAMRTVFYLWESRSHTLSDVWPYFLQKKVGECWWNEINSSSLVPCVPCTNDSRWFKLSAVLSHAAKDAVARVHDALIGLVRASSVHEASLDHVSRRGNLGNSCFSSNKRSTLRSLRRPVEKKEICSVHHCTYVICYILPLCQWLKVILDAWWFLFLQQSRCFFHWTDVRISGPMDLISSIFPHWEAAHRPRPILRRSSLRCGRPVQVWSSAGPSTLEAAVIVESSEIQTLRWLQNLQVINDMNDSEWSWILDHLLNGSPSMVLSGCTSPEKNFFGEEETNGWGRSQAISYGLQ